jgi:hypothetical protein
MQLQAQKTQWPRQLGAFFRNFVMQDYKEGMKIIQEVVLVHQHCTEQTNRG